MNRGANQITTEITEKRLRVVTRVIHGRLFNESIFVRNRPLDLFGAKALPENIPSLLEGFFFFL